LHQDRAFSAGRLSYPPEVQPLDNLWGGDNALGGTLGRSRPSQDRSGGAMMARPATRWPIDFPRAPG